MDDPLNIIKNHVHIFFYCSICILLEPCLTEPCIHAASEILRSIDENVDPCDDFYGFSCNKWIKNNPIPDGKSMWGTFGKLEQRNQLVVKNVLGKCIFIIFL